MFSYVFLMSHLENVENTVCLQGFRHARAADARVCTLYFLQWIIDVDDKTSMSRRKMLILYCFLQGNVGPPALNRYLPRRGGAALYSNKEYGFRVRV